MTVSKPGCCALTGTLQKEGLIGNCLRTCQHSGLTHIAVDEGHRDHIQHLRMPDAELQHQSAVDSTQGVQSKPVCSHPQWPVVSSHLSAVDSRDDGGMWPPDMDAVVSPSSWPAARSEVMATGGLDAADGALVCARPSTDGGLLRLPARLKLHERRRSDGAHGF